MDILNYSDRLNQRLGEPQAYQLLRSLGQQTFSKLGWPTKRMESWRYSPVHRLKDDYIPQLSSLQNLSLELPSLLEMWSSELFWPIVTFNGTIIHLATELESQIEVMPLKEALQKNAIDSLSISETSDALEAMSLAFFDLGFFLKIKERTLIEKPIHWINVFSSSDTKALYHHRMVIKAEAASNFTLLESNIVMGGEENSWLNLKSSIELETSAHVCYVQWNELNRSNQCTHKIDFTVNNDAYLHCLHGALSEGWNRINLNINCVGSRAEVIAHGLGLSRDQGTIDQQTKLFFKGVENRAEQFCKNLLLDKSRAIFNGMIRIDPQAQKTDSSQLHRSLLLSAEAEVDTKPELEIFADDVKATHGATIGQLREDELFYFQSRGISKEKAKTLLCTAFLFDLCDRVNDDSLQRFLKSRIEGFWKRGNL